MLSDTKADLPRLRAELSNVLDEAGYLRRRIERLEREQHDDFRKAIEAAQKARESCWCTTCRPNIFPNIRFVVCPDCGNKRCPKAHNHTLACTDSNAPGQSGSSWEHVKPVQWCTSCGEGVTTLCRGKADNCPRGLPQPGKECET